MHTSYKVQVNSDSTAYRFNIRVQMATTNSSNKTRFDKLNTRFASNVSTIKHLMLPRRSHMQSGVVHLTDPSQNLAPLQQQTMSLFQATSPLQATDNVTPPGNSQCHPSRQQTSPLQQQTMSPLQATDNVTPPGNRQCHPSRQRMS